MTSDAVDHVLEKLQHVKEVGSGWRARCPSHDDRAPSLSVNEGRDGRVLLHCHAGCSTESVVAAIGLDLRDMFPTGASLTKDDSRSRTDRSQHHPGKRDWRADAERYAAALGEARLEALARELGVSTESLIQIGVGWAADEWGGAFSFPELDGERRVVGIGLRTPEGRKVFVKGGHRGVVVPANLDDLPDPVLVVEGPSDVAACGTLGIASVGRPSCGQGADLLAELLHERAVVVVGERDEKPDGAWPGRDGAQRVAGGLAQAWGRPVRWVLPPAPAKDVRAWLFDRSKGGSRLG